MKSTITALLCVGAFSAAAPVSAAQNSAMPAVCAASNSTKKVYATGVSQGKELVEQAWQVVGDCGQLAYFSEILKENVEAYTLSGTSTWLMCRYSGMVNGVYQELDTVWTRCGGECCSEGKAIGELAASLYCRLSELLDGMIVPDNFFPRPVTTCTGFSQCCQNMFWDTTKLDCNEYTTPQFYNVWTRSGTLTCNG